MKIAITAKDTNENGEVDPRFGRAASFCIYDTETKEFTFVPNTQSLDSASGAGIQAAKTIIDQGVNALITGHCGPKAFKALTAAEVNIYVNVTGSIQEAIQLLEQEKLQKADAADVDGHW